MKKLLVNLAVLAGIFCFSKTASAQPYQVTPTSEQFQSTMTCYSIQVSSQIALGVVVSTQTLWRSASIQNRDSSANLYFSPDVLVSSQTGTTFNSHVGIEIAFGTPGQTAGVVMVPGEQLYILNDSATKTSLATICLGR